MICPNCQTSNPDGAKFCNECGTELPAPCPNCGHHNPAGAKFCNECGHRLDGTAESPTASTRPTPERQGRTHGAPAQEGERRIVTALFCDLSGSTSAAGQLDPEEWTEIMNGAFEQMIGPIQKYEGTVVRLLGDAVLAFFGAPIAHEDDPQRAVLAALEMQSGIRSYRTRVRREWGVDFDVRCGINTGLAVVGSVGSDTHVEYTALGDAVNVAARMEQTAQPGTVQLSEATYRLVAPLFDVEVLGEIEVKGKDEPVSAYRVLGPKAAQGRLRGIEGLEAQFVGREAELVKLKEAIVNLQRGTGNIVFLTGEAGLGKSRLIRELRTTSEEAYADIRWFTASSLSYEMVRPYGLFQRLMRNVCAIGEDASPPEVHQGIERALERTPVEQRVPTQQVLETLFKVAGESANTPRLEGETFKGQLYVTMHALWYEWATAGPMVLVFDDLHWADPASIELLEYLLTFIDDAPILIICAMRPDVQSSGWALKTHAEDRFQHGSLEIELRTLSSDESDLLINNLLFADLPASLREQVLEKAAGNPLFVEEVVRTLIDSGAVMHDQREDRWIVVQNLDDIHIPDNIQSLLMARIDRLEREVRQTLQLAAVIGRSFHFRVLREISEQDRSRLTQHMGKLQQGELIFEAVRQPELEYIFHHVLVQETAYATILHRQRREFHLRVGETLEVLFPDQLEEHAVVLAYHFDQANQYDRALHYHTVAGDAAYRLYSHEEAISHYDRALELALQHDSGDLEKSSDRLQHLYLRKGRALELHGNYAEAVATYEALAEMGDRLGSRSLQLASLLALGTIHSTLTPIADGKLGKTIGEEALTLARALGDPQSEAKALWNLMNFHNYYLGVMEQAARYGEEALAIALELDLNEQLAYIQNDLHWVYMHMGDLRRAWTLLEESQKRWRNLGNLPMLLDNLFGSATFHIFTGEFDKAIAIAEEGVQIAQSIRNVWNYAALRATMSFVYRLRGDNGRAIACLERTADFIDDESPGMHHSFIWMLLALSYAESGMVKRGLKVVERTQRRFETMALTFRMAAFHAAVETRLQLLDGNVPAAEKAMQRGQVTASGSGLFSILGYLNPFVMCELALTNADFDRAIELVDEFYSVYEATVARWALTEFRYLKAQAMLALGDKDGAEIALNQARSEAEEMGLLRIHWPILAALAELEAERGDTTAATELREEARIILNRIAGGLPEGEPRTSFLAQPEVRNLTGPARD